MEDNHLLKVNSFLFLEQKLSNKEQLLQLLHKTLFSKNNIFMKNEEKKCKESQRDQ